MSTLQMKFQEIFWLTCELTISIEVYNEIPVFSASNTFGTAAQNLIKFLYLHIRGDRFRESSQNVQLFFASSQNSQNLV